MYRWIIFAGIILVFMLKGTSINAQEILLKPIPPPPPVELRYSAPLSVKQGEDVPATVQFTALEDLEKLEVEVIPTEGLEWVLGDRKVQYQSLRKGETKSLTIRFRLTDPEVGYFAVSVVTVSLVGQRGESYIFAVGAPGPLQEEKEKKFRTRTPEGREIILSPGTPRNP